MVTVLEGKGRFTVGCEVSNLEQGETLIMPKDIPHAVYGEERFKMQRVVSFQKSDRQPSKQRSSHLDALFLLFTSLPPA